MILVYYPKCSTCKKAKKWLDDKGKVYDIRNIKEENPTFDDLKDWHNKSGLTLRRFFNTSGILYREMGLKDKLDSMTEDEMLNLLATDGMLVKRPIAIDGDKVLVGFKESEWNETL